MRLDRLLTVLLSESRQGEKNGVKETAAVASTVRKKQTRGTEQKLGTRETRKQKKNSEKDRK